MDAAETNGYVELNDGDSLACEQFVRDNYEGLYRWFYWLTSDRDRAADLTQEAFASFWHSLQRYAAKRSMPQTAPRVWLFAVGRNVWRKHCRQRQRRRQQETELPTEEISSGEPSVELGAEQREFAQALAEQVARLPDDYREVFTLRVWQEMDYEQIAAIQNINRDLARWRFFRARQMIRSAMKAWQLQEENHGV